MGSLALTGQPAKQAPFEPLPGDVTMCRTATSTRWPPRSTDDTAAVFLEPIMGEGGVVVPPPGYLAAAREITAAHGALLVLDEVQTGVGRTGDVFRAPERRRHTRMWSPWPRGSAAACRSAPASASVPPPV